MFSARFYSKGTVYLLLAILVGLLASYFPVIVSQFRNIPGDIGDSRFNHYILEWGYRFITHQAESFSFWNPPIFYPSSNALAYSDILLGTAPFYWFNRLIGFSDHHSYLLWMFEMSTLNFACFYLWLKRGVRLSQLASICGAYLFAFSASRLNFLNHQQLLPVFFMPLAAWSIQEILKFPKRIKRIAWEALFALSIIGQLYSGFYMGWFLVIGLMISFLVGLFDQKTRLKLLQIISIDWPQILILGAITSLSLYPMASHYLQAAKEVGLRDYSKIYIPPFTSYLKIGNGSLLYSWQLRFFSPQDNSEYRVSIGIITLALSLIGFVKTRRLSTSKILGLTLVITILITSQFSNGFTFWNYFFKIIPGASAIRALTRVGLACLFFFALGFAKFVETHQRKPILLIFLLAICFSEQLRELPSFDPERNNQQINRIANRVEKRCHAFLLLTSDSKYTDFESSLDAMWTSLKSEGRIVPTLNGYSGNTPPHWKAEAGQPFQKEWLTQWSQIHQINHQNICVINNP